MAQGGGNLKNQRATINLLLLLLVPFPIFFIITTPYVFFTSQVLMSGAALLALPLAIGTCFFIKYDLSHIECESERKGYVFVKYLFSPFIAAIFFVVLVSGGHFYTKIFGSFYTSEILVAQKLPGYTRICRGRTRLKSPHTNTLLKRTICVDKEFAQELKNIDFVKVSGKKSFFGYTVEHHAVAEPVEGDFFVRLDSANRFWGVFVPCPGSVCRNFRLYEGYVPVSSQE